MRSPRINDRGAIAGHLVRIRHVTAPNNLTNNTSARGPSSGNPVHVVAALAAFDKSPKRFWSKVVKLNPAGNCWIWLSARNRQGYGQFWVPTLRRAYPAHRIVYAWAGNTIPAGLCVCHRCDNRLCVNPAHLFLATHGDNLRDMVRKGRHPETVRQSQMGAGV